MGDLLKYMIVAYAKKYQIREKVLIELLQKIKGAVFCITWLYDQLYSPEGRKTEEKKHTHKLN